MNQLKQPIVILGGDRRQKAAAEELIRRGYPVQTRELEPGGPDWRAEAAGADILLLPAPCTRDNVCLFTPLSDSRVELKELGALLRPSTLVIGGKLETLPAEQVCKEDLLTREDYQWRNAVPTAEAALALALEQRQKTLHTSRCLVIGGGRIGQVLSRLLQALGAIVCVSARKSADLARTEALGMEAYRTEQIRDIADRFDLIFNTVPALVLDRRVLERVSDQCIILDLASAPGGTDRLAAEAFGRTVISAPGLPGKVTPITAGIIVARTVDEIIHSTNGRKNTHGQ